MPLCLIVVVEIHDRRQARVEEASVGQWFDRRPALVLGDTGAGVWIVGVAAWRKDPAIGLHRSDVGAGNLNLRRITAAIGRARLQSKRTQRAELPPAAIATAWPDFERCWS